MNHLTLVETVLTVLLRLVLRHLHFILFLLLLIMVSFTQSFSLALILVKGALWDLRLCFLFSPFLLLLLVAHNLVLVPEFSHLSKGSVLRLKLLGQ